MGSEVNDFEEVKFRVETAQKWYDQQQFQWIQIH